jgi:hypothetical protein
MKPIDIDSRYTVEMVGKQLCMCCNGKIMPNQIKLSIDSTSDEYHTLLTVSFYDCSLY